MLRIIFKNGNIRNINVDKTFFLDQKGRDKISRAELTEKVLDIVSDTGTYQELYVAALIVDGEVLVEKGPYPLNSPYEAEDVFEKGNTLEYRNHVKRLKKAARNFKFSYIINRGSNGVFITPLEIAA